MTSKLEFVLRSGYYALRKGYVDRYTNQVVKEYTSSWESFREILASSDTLDQWLAIDGFDERDDWFNVDGNLSHQRYNSSNFYRATLRQALDRHFAGVQSITEYGCGLGRNLLFLKRLYPRLRCFGYELVPEGVEIARRAAEKFGIEVEYSQLDYVRDPDAKFVFPDTDAAFTMFSLEQLPTGCDIALQRMLARVRVGTIHLEPVIENYPYSLRGMISRLDHRKTGYLGSFPQAVRHQSLASVWHERMASSHNALMFPSVYVLKK